MSAHRCHARGCTTAVAPRLLMCGRHWRMVPTHIQAAVWATYVRGQEVRKDPSPGYIEAATAAIDAVAAKEYKKITRLRPGAYSIDGELHLDIPELLRGHGIADTPENRAMVEQTAIHMFGELGIPLDVVE